MLQDSPPWYYTFAEGVISKEDIKKCKDTTANNDSLDCYNQGVTGCGKWILDTMKMTLPKFPDCPINYIYEHRVCNKEYQIRKVSIELIDILACDGLIEYIIYGGGEETGENFVLLRDRVEHVFEMAFDEYSKQCFLVNMYYKTPEYARDMFNCDNPNLPPDGMHFITYLKSSCVSYCGTYYWTPEKGVQWSFSEDPCIDGFTCCKKKVWYCWDKNTNQPVQHAEIEEGEAACDPDALPVKSRCYDGTGIIERYISPCEPSCK